jgi:XTP/dITP diphosphohydrolase
VKLIFASNNAHKLNELRNAVGSAFEIISLSDAGIVQEIPEPFDTLKENAEIKAETIYRLSGSTNCFSEDTGLEVDFLQGAPGIRSARYAGEPASAEKNIQKLLAALGNATMRSARFKTVICLIFEKEKYFFEGICEGRILHQRCGDTGFGYDPVFVPAGADKTFAQMNTEEKNIYSHRRKAADQLIRFLHTTTEFFGHAANKN